MKTWTLCFAVCVASACSQHQDLADSRMNDDAAPGTLPSKTCVLSTPDAGAPPPVVAIWDGYMEQAFAGTGHDQVHVVVRASDSGQLSATAMFGAPAAPLSPPVTSETCDPVDPVNTTATPAAPPLQLLEGFEYQLTRVVASDIRLQFTVSTYQPLANWCACQVPFDDGQGGFHCFPNVSIGVSGKADGGTTCTYALGAGPSTPAETVTTACCRMERCLAFQCVCTALGCSYNADYGTAFDLSINGNRADGAGLHLLRTQ
ncbi:MAG TPA: hypothetical protein VHO67_22430 [Polyangia bacterium]|nr:hypothetical protein [Polyangia bacterium]